MIKRKAKTKKILMKHTLNRLFYRYGIKCTQTEWEYMNGQIRKKRAKFVFKQSNTRSHWIVELNNEKIWCVYNNVLNAVSTCLPRQVIEKPYLVKKHLEDAI